MIKKSYYFTIRHLSGKNAKSFLFKVNVLNLVFRNTDNTVNTYKYSQ